MTSQSTFTLPQMMLFVGFTSLTVIGAQFVEPTPGMPQEYAPDPTPQLVLLTVAVTVLAVTKLVGWYLGRGGSE